MHWIVQAYYIFNVRIALKQFGKPGDFDTVCLILILKIKVLIMSTGEELEIVNCINSVTEFSIKRYRKMGITGGA